MRLPQIEDQFRRNVRELRNHYGWSQADLAARIGWPQQVLGKLENGGRRVRLDDCRLLANALGVSLPSLITNEVDKAEAEFLALRGELARHEARSRSAERMLRAVRRDVEQARARLDAQTPASSPLRPRRERADVDEIEVPNAGVDQNWRSDPRLRRLHALAAAGDDAAAYELALAEVLAERAAHETPVTDVADVADVAAQPKDSRRKP